MVRQAVTWVLVGVILGSIIGYIIFLQTGVPQTTKSENEIEVVPIGALLLLSGAQESYGKRGQAALQLAIEDVNKYAESIGSRFRFKLLPEDTKTDPQTAVEKIQSLATLGVKVVIGPYTSAETAAVKTFADSSKIVVVSPASISSNLALSGDCVLGS
ncbi:MAG: hypothetical protein DRJ35_06310 [Thermoprotei archaeon]|nr:MAG: hypothetical protein DRJ35_06310 [Thermoprotei archaeon]